MDRIRVVRIRFGGSVREHELDWEAIADAQRRDEYDSGRYSPPRDKMGGYAGQARPHKR